MSECCECESVTLIGLLQERNVVKFNVCKANWIVNIGRAKQCKEEEKMFMR